MRAKNRTMSERPQYVGRPRPSWFISTIGTPGNFVANAAAVSDRDELEFTALEFTATTANVTPCSRTSAASKLTCTSLVFGEFPEVVLLDSIVGRPQVPYPVDGDGMDRFALLPIYIAQVDRDEATPFVDLLDDPCTGHFLGRAKLLAEVRFDLHLDDRRVFFVVLYFAVAVISPFGHDFPPRNCSSFTQAHMTNL